MKKIISILLILSMVLSCCLVVSANENITVELDGKAIAFDVPPQIINNRTMVPLRAIFEALSATVDWDGDTQTVTSTKDNTTISLTINNPIMYVNDGPVTLDSPACLIGGRTLVPVRAISEAFGIAVKWVNYSNTVLISTSGEFLETNVTMYAVDGRTQIVPQRQAEANLLVGWYLEPVTMMYAHDGRTLVVPISAVEAYKNVGWFTNQVLASYNYYSDIDAPTYDSVTGEKYVGLNPDWKPEVVGNSSSQCYLYKDEDNSSMYKYRDVLKKDFGWEDYRLDTTYETYINKKSGKIEKRALNSYYMLKKGNKTLTVLYGFKTGTVSVSQSKY